MKIFDERKWRSFDRNILIIENWRELQTNIKKIKVNLDRDFEEDLLYYLLTASD
jgi:hypothetical protein